MTTTLWLIVLAGALSIVYGIVTTRSLMAADAGYGPYAGNLRGRARRRHRPISTVSTPPSPSSAW